MSKITEALAFQRELLKNQASNAKRLRDAIKANPGFTKFVKALEAAVPEIDVYIGVYSVSVTVPVLSMKHMLECIEAAELAMGIEFDHTEDYAASGERKFSSSKAWWLSITARIPLEQTDGQTCRRIKTGTKVVEQDVYALECSE